MKAKNRKLNKNYLWDILEIDWKEVTVTFNGNKIDLPKVVIIKLQDKIKVRKLMNREPLLFHLMLKQGITWFTLATETQESVYILNKCRHTSKIFYFQMACILQPECNLLHSFVRCHLPVEMVDVEVRIASMQGAHALHRDRTCPVIKCNPWSTRLCSHCNIIKKMKTYLELEGKLGPKPQPQSNQFRPPQPNTNPHVRKDSKATKMRKKLIPTKKYKVKVVARPNSSNVTAQSPLTNPKAPQNPEGQKPSTEGTPGNNPPPLENDPVHTCTPWPEARKISGNLLD